MPTLFVVLQCDTNTPELDHLQLLVDTIQQRHPTEEFAIVQLEPFTVVQEFTQEASSLFSKQFQNRISLNASQWEEQLSILINWLESEDSNLHSPHIQIIFITNYSSLQTTLQMDHLLFQKLNPLFSMELFFKLHMICFMDQKQTISLEGCKNWCRMHNYGQLVEISGLEPIQKLIKEEGAKQIPALHPILNHFFESNYKKYVGNIVMGHLQQEHVALIPDPHLLFFNKSKFDYSKLPTSLSIIGFLHQDFISSPICFSKHIVQILPSEMVSEIESSVQPSKKKLKISQQKVVKILEFSYNLEGASLNDLLYSAMEHKKCAIVHLYDNFYGYLASAYTSSHSSLIFGIIDRIPYLKISIPDLVQSTVADNYSQSVSFSSKATYLFDAVPSQARTYSAPIPNFSQEGLLAALDRVGKAAKTLPGKPITFLNECEKLRKNANIYMNSSLIAGLIKFLDTLKEANAQTNSIIEDVQKQLQEDPSKKISGSKASD